MRITWINGNNPKIHCVNGGITSAETRSSCNKMWRLGVDAQTNSCLLNTTFERWRALKNELNLPNDDSVASYLLFLYSQLNRGNNNSGQQEEQAEREEYDRSPSHPLLGKVDSPSRDQSSPSCDQLLYRDDVPLRYQCIDGDMEAVIREDVARQHNNMRCVFEWPY